jgi:hypothetical protein
VNPSVKSPIGKPALDAMLDQSFARVRDERAVATPDLLKLSSEAAAMIAEQFPGDRETAGRVVMSVVQLLAGFSDQFSEETADVLDSLTDIFALAAEQVVREAGAR